MGWYVINEREPENLLIEFLMRPSDPVSKFVLATHKNIKKATDFKNEAAAKQEAQKMNDFMAQCGWQNNYKFLAIKKSEL
jgi:hypothetical protein